MKRDTVGTHPRWKILNLFHFSPRGMRRYIFPSHREGEFYLRKFSELRSRTIGDLKATRNSLQIPTIKFVSLADSAILRNNIGRHVNVTGGVGAKFARKFLRLLVARRILSSGAN